MKVKSSRGELKFLKEIRDTTVLTKEEEVLLAARVQEAHRVQMSREYFQQEHGRKPSCDELSLVSHLVRTYTRFLSGIRHAQTDSDLTFKYLARPTMKSRSWRLMLALRNSSS